MSVSPIFSIIIPVYNREKTIRLCLDSILRQTFTDYEVFVIDDGSSDSTYSICYEYQKNDKRFILKSQDNAGPSKARNLGIEASHGKYIIFVDSDDALGHKMLDDLNYYCQQKEFDLLMYGNVGAIVKNDKWDEVKSRNKISHYSGPEILKFFFNYPYSQNKFFVWNKLFDAEIIRNNCIRFDEDVNLGEDQVFLCSYLKNVNKFCLTSQVLYYNLAVEGTPPGLGGTARTSANYLHNQFANYQAILSLYYYLQNDIIREYATNYITDRVITRIGFRNVPSVFNRLECSEFKKFVIERIAPIIKDEYVNINSIHDLEIRALTEKIYNGEIEEFIHYCQIEKAKAEILKIYYKLRYKVARWLR